jgi:hypothetical protein
MRRQLSLLISSLRAPQLSREHCDVDDNSELSSDAEADGQEEMVWDAAFGDGNGGQMQPQNQQRQRLLGLAFVWEDQPYHAGRLP